MVHKLKQKFVVKKVDFLAQIEILGSEVCTKKVLGTDSSRRVGTLIRASRTWTWRRAILSTHLVSKEELFAVLAGLYRRVTGRLLYVARQRPDAQQAMKELARGMSSPTHVHWARLKRVIRYLVKKRVNIFEENDQSQWYQRWRKQNKCRKFSVGVTKIHTSFSKRNRQQPKQTQRGLDVEG